MLTFKQFIAEAEVKKSLSWVVKGRHNYHSEHQIGKDILRVRYKPYAKFDHEYNVEYPHNHYEVTADVNLTQDRTHLGKKSSKDRIAGVNAVKQSLHTFIAQRKPRRLSFKGNTVGKEELYWKYAKHLAKKYKAKLTSNNGEHTIHFSHFRHEDT